MILNYTEYFREERDIYVQNISNCQISIPFPMGNGSVADHLFVNNRDPVNLTRFIPFKAIKESIDLRKILSRVPAVLKLMDESEYMAYYGQRAAKTGLPVDRAIEHADEVRASIQNHTPLPNAPEPTKLHEVVEDGKRLGEHKIVRPIDGTVSEDEVVNARVLNVCLQVHPGLDEDQRMPAQTILSELEAINDLTLADYEYIQGHGYYKSVKNFAKEKIKEMLNVGEKDDTVPAPVVAKVEIPVVVLPPAVK